MLIAKYFDFQINNHIKDMDGNMMNNSNKRKVKVRKFCWSPKYNKSTIRLQAGAKKKQNNYTSKQFR